MKIKYAKMSVYVTWREDAPPSDAELALVLNTVDEVIAAAIEPLKQEGLVCPLIRTVDQDGSWEYDGYDLEGEEEE